jgi:CHAD domain-containing protein
VGERFSVEGVDAGTPLVVAAPAMLVAKAEPLFRLEGAARSGADVDAVHDMRVASRRLREAMRLFAPLYPRQSFARWSGRIRRVTRALGPVRDADVFIETFGRMAADLDEGGRRAVAFLVGRRLGQRERQLERLDRELAGLDLRLAGKEFARLVVSVGEDSQSRGSLAEFAYAAVAERAAVVLRLQPDALDETRVANQHALRILYKRLRYAVEVFATCYGDAFDGIHDVLTAIQDALGDLHDHRLFLDLLADPAVVVAAARGGVTEADLAEIGVVLNARARDAYGRFIVLATAHPAEAMLPELLVPLTRRPEKPAVEPSSSRALATEALATRDASVQVTPEDAADPLLDVRVVEERDDSLPYLTDTGELVIPHDDLEVEAWGAVAADRAADAGTGR